MKRFADMNDAEFAAARKIGFEKSFEKIKKTERPKLGRKAVAEILDVMFSNPENDGAGIPAIDLADALDMLNAKRTGAAPKFWRTMQQLIDARRVVQTQPTPYSRFKALREIPIRAESIGNGDDPVFVVTIDIEEAASEAVVVRAITRSVAMSKTLAWLKSIDFDNLDGVKLTVSEYESVHILL